jgi:hypothetical protein
MKRKCHSKNRENDGWETYDFYHGIISKMSTESSRSFIGKYERSIYKWMTCLQRGHRDRIKQTPFELTKMSAEKPDGLAWSSHQKLCLLRNLRRTSTKKDMGMTWPCLYSYTMDLSNIENPSKCCWSDKRQDPTWRCWGSAPQCFFRFQGIVRRCWPWCFCGPRVLLLFHLVWSHTFNTLGADVVPFWDSLGWSLRLHMKRVYK